MHLSQRQREPKLSLLLYHLFKWSVVAPLFHAYLHGRIVNAQAVPQRGPLIIVSNHASYFDPPLLSNAVRRPVAFMAKAELFKIPILKTLIRLYGAYPVQRGTRDRSAIRAAHQAQVPLLPVCLWGTEKILSHGPFPRPVPVTVRIGQLIPPPSNSSRPELEAATQACAAQINALYDLER